MTNNQISTRGGNEPEATEEVHIAKAQRSTRGGSINEKDEPKDEEIHAIEEPDASNDQRPTANRHRLRKGITVDSGAANNVMPKKMVRNKTKIRQSAGSKKKLHYVTANNARIPNEGETEFKFKTAEGDDEELTFQIAEVNKALAAVSYLVDNNYRVIFDKDMATGKDVSRMIHKPSGRIARFRRERNIWILDAIIELDEENERSFRRRG